MEADETFGTRSMITWFWGYMNDKPRVAQNVMSPSFEGAVVGINDSPMILTQKRYY